MKYVVAQLFMDIAGVRTGLIGTLGVDDFDKSPQLRHSKDHKILLRVLLPLAVLGAIIITITVLQLNGTLRKFLDRQSMFGMIGIVVAINIIGFSLIFALLNVWHFIRDRFLGQQDS
jgi:hypothetical protein